MFLILKWIKIKIQVEKNQDSAFSSLAEWDMRVLWDLITRLLFWKKNTLGMNGISTFIHIELNLRAIIALIQKFQQCSLSVYMMIFKVVFFLWKEVVLMLIQWSYGSFSVSHCQWHLNKLWKPWSTTERTDPVFWVLFGLSLTPRLPLGEFLKEQNLSQSMAWYKSDLQKGRYIPVLKCFE